jgi:uncharacterized protein (TIGR03118 family)
VESRLLPSVFARIRQSKEDSMQRRSFALICGLGVLLFFSPSLSWAQYQLKNLNSNQFREAKNIDSLIANAWGLVRGATTPWWVSDNFTGWSTLYDQNGVKQGLEVSIPPAANGVIGQPTGVVTTLPNNTFHLSGALVLFIFATLDGTISAWSPTGFDAKIAVDNSPSKASYTGLAVTNKSSANLLFAADNANNQVDIFDDNFSPKGTFNSDSSIPNGFSVFGIRDINGQVFVSYAANSGGPGGFIDVYNEDGTLVGPFGHGGAPLNQPWGFAVAPRGFGPLSNTLLISNNTNDGTINGFNARGEFVGTITDRGHHPIRIDQLWAIDFGGGNATNGPATTLFFTAGPHNNFAGTFGSIVFGK